MPLIIADAVNRLYTDTILLLPYKVCRANNYLKQMASSLGVGYDLEQSLHKALESSGLASKLKVAYVLSNPADIIIGVSLLEALIIKQEIKDSTIFYPHTKLDSIEGVPFTDPIDLELKIRACLDS